MKGEAEQVERPQPLFWRLHMAPNAKIAMRVGDWKILADETLSEFELYDLKADPKEATDLKEKEADLDEVFAWMLWYNRARLHSTLAYVSPMQFEENWLANQPRQASA